MTVYLNDQFIPEAEAMISVFDRGFLYGDGLFESIRVAHSKPFRWSDHMERLVHGCKLLRLPLPKPVGDLLLIARRLMEINGMPDGILRITLSRGRGARGYSPRGANQPTLLLSLHPLPVVTQPWKLITSSLRLSVGDPLACAKTSNKLPQILARAEADDAGADDALLLDSNGHVAETSSGNLFWMQNEKLFTPALQSGIIPGITRKVVLDLAQTFQIPVEQIMAPKEVLHSAEGVFVTVSSCGIIEVSHLDGVTLRASDRVNALKSAYKALLERGDEPI